MTQFLTIKTKHYAKFDGTMTTIKTHHFNNLPVLTFNTYKCTDRSKPTFLTNILQYNRNLTALHTNAYKIHKNILQLEHNSKNKIMYFKITSTYP